MYITGDINLDPKIRYQEAQEESEVKRSLQYLKELGSLLKKGVKGCRMLSQYGTQYGIQVTHVKVMGETLSSLGVVSQIASSILFFEKSYRYMKSDNMGCNLESVKQILMASAETLTYGMWIAQIEQLGGSIRLLSSLNSMSLGIAFLMPVLNLIMHLREEGYNAFYGVQCYKTIFEIGVALLSVYLFVTALTLSSYVQALITGANFAVSYI